MSKKNFIIGGILVIFLITVFVIIGNNQTNNSASNNQTNVSQISQTNSSTFETINTVQVLKNRLDQKNPGDVLLDVRTPQEFSDGHIKNAINIDLANPNFALEIQKLDKTKTYIIFCRSGNRALTASQEMSKIGLKTVYSKQGITDWQTAGFETVK
jgi:rhodanese-related sulfurtransferase